MKQLFEFEQHFEEEMVFEGESKPNYESTIQQYQIVAKGIKEYKPR